MNLILRIIVLLLVWPLSLLYGQEYGYTHYAITNGLPGQHIYYIYQDKDGFMWFATEGGVCRYDGNQYKVFTLADGLPDIEIFGMYSDTNDRLWMLPFKKSLCFYKHGKFHTSENTPYLDKVKVKNRLYGVTEDSEQNIWLYEDSFIYMIAPSGQVTTFSVLDKIPIEYCTKIAPSSNGGILVSMKNGVYHFNRNKVRQLETHTPWKEGASIPLRHVGLSKDMLVSMSLTEKGYKAISFKYNKTLFLSHPQNNNISIVNDSTFFMCTPFGAYQYNFLNPAQNGRAFLHGKNVGFVYEDKEHNLWFSVLGDGVYKLSSLEIRNFKFEKLSDDNLPISFLTKENQNYILSNSSGVVFITKDFKKFTRHIIDSTLHTIWPSSIRYIKKTSDNKNWLIIDSDCIEKYDLNFKRIAHIAISSKTIFDPPGREILITTFNSALVFDEDVFTISETLWTERTTAIFRSKAGIIYIGTLSGLYIHNKNNQHEFMGDTDSLLRHRPSVFGEMDNGTVLVGTYGNGLIGLQNHNVRFHFSQENGLSNNIITAIITAGTDLWIGTSKGLNRISFQKENYSITQFGLADGLISDNINKLTLKNDTLYIGTPNGISLFNINKPNQPSSCYLKVTKVVINGHERLIQNSYTLTPGEKDFSIEFAGLSFKSEGGIHYKYRITGLFEWRSLTQNSLQLAALPFGNFTLELMAINKFGVTSEPVFIGLKLPKPFYRNTYFIVLVIMVSVFGFVGIGYLRLRLTQNHQREKELVNSKMVRLEQYALQAQMNPHFIFNCLSSLQHYLYENNVKEGNRLLTRFSSLVRQTLDNSSQLFISLDDEIKYLTNYLEVEQIRYDHKFHFEISVDDDLPVERVNIPNMILQPFVENAIKHGIRYVSDGKIDISFSIERDMLICSVKDNGIGRNNTKSSRGILHDSHHSKGLSLTSRRINLLNSMANGNVMLSIKDLVDEAEKSLGTQVIVKVPLGYNLKSY